VKKRDLAVNEDYLDLLVRALSGELSDEVQYRHLDLQKARVEGQQFPGIFSLEACQELFRQANLEFAAQLGPLETTAEQVLGLDDKGLFEYLNWMNPIGSPHSMCGKAKLENVRACMHDILTQDVPGDFIETGVWKGGMTVLMRGVLKAHGNTDRKVWVADSFEGLPKPDPATHLKDALFWFLMYPLGYLQIPLEYTEGLFSRYGLLDDQVRFLKGWFRDTLPNAGIRQLALARLDGDLYESTYDALSYLYPLLSPGGYLIIDDYGVPCGCQQAVDDYRSAQGIETPMLPLPPAAVYWRKEA
jgi:hypothetical protein